jgi:hypothetical protein
MKASDAHLGVIPDLATHAVDGLSTTAVGMQPDLVARLGATRGLFKPACARLRHPVACMPGGGHVLDREAHVTSKLVQAYMHGAYSIRHGTCLRPS